jgi:hypothetical protein
MRWIADWISDSFPYRLHIGRSTPLGRPKPHFHLYLVRLRRKKHVVVTIATSALTLYELIGGDRIIKSVADTVAEKGISP